MIFASLCPKNCEHKNKDPNIRFQSTTSTTTSIYKNIALVIYIDIKL